MMIPARSPIMAIVSATQNAPQQYFGNFHCLHLQSAQTGGIYPNIEGVWASMSCTFQVHVGLSSLSPGPFRGGQLPYSSHVGVVYDQHGGFQKSGALYCRPQVVGLLS